MELHCWEGLGDIYMGKGRHGTPLWLHIRGMCMIQNPEETPMLNRHGYLRRDFPPIAIAYDFFCPLPLFASLGGVALVPLPGGRNGSFSSLFSFSLASICARKLNH